MREILGDIRRWRAEGRAVALARVVGLDGSGPRDPGAAMAVNGDGEPAGSVSGGCVEGAVVTEALAALSDGRPRLVSFGYSDDEAFAVGLTCGGTITVFVEPLDSWEADVDDDGGSLLDRLAARIEAGRPVAVATVVEGPNLGAKVLVDPAADVSGPGAGSDPAGDVPGSGDAVGVVGAAATGGGLGHPDLDRVVVRDARAQIESGLTATRHYGPEGQARRQDVAVFVECFAPPPRMVVFGAVDFTAALARTAKVLGYRVTVCDARAAFATRARFPMADDVVVAWPQRHLADVGADLGPRDAICVLTHDPKFDVPAVVAALGTRAGYIGVMGSRRTHAERVERLRQAGIGDADLSRLMAPIGLDIGARSPEETAVSICAEIIALRSGRPAPSLRDTRGPIHRGGPNG